MAQATTWRNWCGTQACSPARVVEAGDETAVAAAVADAAARGETVRVAGAGHSASPLCTTAGTLLSLEPMRGVVEVDVARRRVLALPATRIADFGEPLFAAGLALHNQGDIDAQHIAGAIATATHGSDVRLGSLSSAVRRVRLIVASGDAIEIGEHEPELLRAAQVAMGMLGVVVEIELEVTTAHFIAARTELWSWETTLDSWDESFAGRNFTVFWLPSDASRDAFDLGVPAEAAVADRAFVRVYERRPVLGDDEVVQRRLDRPYRILPYEFEPNHRELEYAVPFARGREAAEAVRDLVRRHHPEAVLPVELRATAADDAYLSPNARRDSMVIAVAGDPEKDFERFLGAAHELLLPFDARPHWGKIHFFTREAVEAAFPEYDRFVAIRRELDPRGVFLNDHLREVLGEERSSQARRAGAAHR